MMTDNLKTGRHGILNCSIRNHGIEICGIDSRGTGKYGSATVVLKNIASKNIELKNMSLDNLRDAYALTAGVINNDQAVRPRTISFSGLQACGTHSMNIDFQLRYERH
jgi:hypothetical protein